MERYQKQLTITTRIVALFDASENPDPKVLMELMQEVRAGCTPGGRQGARASRRLVRSVGLTTVCCLLCVA